MTTIGAPQSSVSTNWWKLSVGLDAGSTLFAGLTGLSSATSEKKLFKHKAKMNRRAAEDVIRGSRQEIAIVRDRAALVMADLESDAVSRGIDVDSLVVGRLQEETLRFSEFEVVNIAYNAAWRAYNFNFDAATNIIQGKAAVAAARNNIISGALGSLSRGTESFLTDRRFRATS